MRDLVKKHIYDKERYRRLKGDGLIPDRRIYSKKWRNEHVEECKAWREARKELRYLIHKRWKERKIGMSYPTWWLCDICNKPIAGINICYEHDHTTGKFRGWTCRGCNAKLGWYESFEKRITEYLK
jgi:hypothetical protein